MVYSTLIKAYTAMKYKFSKNCGRPKLKQSKCVDDLPTFGSKEIIDVLKEKQLITNAEYEAALYFKKIFIVNFGSPSVTAYDLRRIPGRDPEKEETKWHSKIALEYKRAAIKLREKNLYYIVANICIYNQHPAFLTTNHDFKISIKNSTSNYLELLNFRKGLKILVNVFGTREVNKPINEIYFANFNQKLSRA